MGLLNGFGQNILMWTVGCVASLYFGNMIRQMIAEYRENATREIKARIATIEDQNLREACRYAVRFIASKFPDSPGNERLERAIKVAQDITPDIIVSDDKLKVIIESEYLEFRHQMMAV